MALETHLHNGIGRAIQVFATNRYCIKKGRGEPDLVLATLVGEDDNTTIS